MSILGKLLDIFIIMKIIFLCAFEYKKINYFFNIKRPRRDVGPQRCNSMWIPSLFLPTCLWQKTIKFVRVLYLKKPFNIYGIYHLVKYSVSMNIGL